MLTRLASTRTSDGLSSLTSTELTALSVSLARVRISVLTGSSLRRR